MQAFRIHAGDNVAALLGDAEPHAAVTVRGGGATLEVMTTQGIRAGHKVALCALAAGERVVKYGFPIGSASQPIASGEWVHLQNCRSLYDTLSSELDVDSGARSETRCV